MKTFSKLLNEISMPKPLAWPGDMADDAMVAVRHNDYIDDAIDFLYSRSNPKERDWINRSRAVIAQYFKSFGLQEETIAEASDNRATVKSSAKTSDLNPLIEAYSSVGSSNGKLSLEGLMNLTVWMRVHAIHVKHQKELAKAVLRAGVGKMVHISSNMLAQTSAEYKAEGKPAPKLAIQLSQHHARKLMGESAILESKYESMIDDAFAGKFGDDLASAINSGDANKAAELLRRHFKKINDKDLNGLIKELGL